MSVSPVNHPYSTLLMNQLSVIGRSLLDKKVYILGVAVLAGIGIIAFFRSPSVQAGAYHIGSFIGEKIGNVVSKIGEICYDWYSSIKTSWKHLTRKSLNRSSGEDTKYLTGHKSSRKCCGDQDSKKIQQKTGLTASEYQVIGDYVQKHVQEWEALAKSKSSSESFTLRIPKEDSKLPRTLHIVIEDNKLYVMVLCKKKGIKDVGYHEVEEGVTHAFDWLTNTRWTYSTSKRHYNTKTNIDFQKYLAQPEEHLKDIQSTLLLPTPLGVTEYADKEGKKKMGYFTPLMDGTLDDVIRTVKLTHTQKLQIMQDLIKYAYLLNQKQVEHCEIGLSRILCKFEGERVRTCIVHYQNAGCNHPSMAEYKLHRQDCPDLPARSPERCRYGESAGPKHLYSKTWIKHDIWGLGITLFQLLKEQVAPPISAYDTVCKMWQNRALLNSDAFFEETFQHKRAPIDEPAKNTPLYFIWQMLHFNPDHRPAATQLFADFQQYMKSEKYVN